MAQGLRYIDNSEIAEMTGPRRALYLRARLSSVDRAARVKPGLAPAAGRV